MHKIIKQMFGIVNIIYYIGLVIRIRVMTKDSNIYYRHYQHGTVKVINYSTDGKLAHVYISTPAKLDTYFVNVYTKDLKVTKL